MRILNWGWRAGHKGHRAMRVLLGWGHVNNWFDSCRGFYLSLDAGKSGRPTGSASSHPSSSRSRASYQTSPIPVKPASAILIMSQPRGP